MIGKLSSAQVEALYLLRDFPGQTDDAMMLVNLGPRHKAIMSALCRKGLARWLVRAERWTITAEGSRVCKDLDADAARRAHQASQDEIVRKWREGAS